MGPDLESLACHRVYRVVGRSLPFHLRSLSPFFAPLRHGALAPSRGIVVGGALQSLFPDVCAWTPLHTLWTVLGARAERTLIVDELLQTLVQKTGLPEDTIK